MAGNPFRRPPSQEPKPPLSHTESSIAFDNAIRSAFQSTGRKSSKTVRIQTPEPLSPEPLSPEEGSPLIRRVSNEAHTGSPPPLSPVDGAPAVGTGQLEQPGKRLGGEVAFQDAEVIDNTRRNSEAASGSPVATSGVANPFHKTLATIEPRNTQDEGGAQHKGEHGKSPGVGNSSSTRPAGPFDVDSFTKMLMTGEGPSQSSDVTDTKTDMTVPDKDPTTSSASAAGRSTHDSSGEAIPRTKPAKPPLPKSRHGTAVNDTGPKTVPFDDFDIPNKESSTTTSDRSRDLSPHSMSSPMSSTRAASPRSQEKASLSGSNPRRSAPPVPLARRNTGPQRPQNTEVTSPRSESPPSSPGKAPKIGQEPSRASKPPPPPPTRRGASSRNSLPPDHITVVDAANQSLENTSIADDYTPLDSKNVKRSLNARPGSSRSSSISERAVAPPPPPTRRQRGSSKSSMEPPSGSRSPNDTRRMSAEINKRGSLEIPQRVSSLSQVSEDGQGGGQQQQQQQPGDVLADLSALQAEVEQLRNQYRKPG